MANRNKFDVTEMGSRLTGIVQERGNGFADVGDYVSSHDGNVYRIVEYVGPIHTGSCGGGNYSHAVLELCDWDDLTDEEAEDIVCSCTL